MDEKYAQLLETLATKLGTTAEHLWGVLVRQAPISGAVDLALCIILALAVWRLIAFVKRKTTPSEDSSGRSRPAEWHGEEGPAWLVAAIMTTVLSGLIIATIPGIVSAFANPEYWALKQLLSMVPR